MQPIGESGSAVVDFSSCVASSFGMNGEGGAPDLHASVPCAGTSSALMRAAPALLGLGPAKVPVGEGLIAIEVFVNVLGSLDDLVVSDDNFGRGGHWHVDILGPGDHVVMFHFMVCGTATPILPAAVLLMLSCPQVLEVMKALHAVVDLWVVIDGVGLVDDLGLLVHGLWDVLFDRNWHLDNLLVVDDLGHLDRLRLGHILVVDFWWRPLSLHRIWLFHDLGREGVGRHLHMDDHRGLGRTRHVHVGVLWNLHSDSLCHGHVLVLGHDSGWARDALLPTAPALMLMRPGSIVHCLSHAVEVHVR